MSSTYSNLPALLIAYNRPEKTRRALDSIWASGIRKLYVSIDGPKNSHQDRLLTNQVLKVIQENTSRFEALILQVGNENLGCKQGCLWALNWYFSQVDFGVVVEDDVEISPSFVEFVSTISHLNDESIWHVNGWSLFDVRNTQGEYVSTNYGHVWGWATWAKRWEKVKVEKREIDENLIGNSHLLDIWKSLDEWTDTWDYFWLLSIEVSLGKIASPQNRMTTNFGFDLQATHKRLKSWKQDRLPIKVEFKARPKYEPSLILDQLFESLYLRDFRGLSVIGMLSSLKFRSFCYLIGKIGFFFFYETIVRVYLRVKSLIFPS
jgi:hypothetical protein